MSSKSAGSFFTRMRQKFFDWRINLEIFNRMMPHVQQEEDHGYSFGNDEELEALTEELRVHASFEHLEQQIRNMPEGYGKMFRHILHRDLHERLLMYKKVARQYTRRPCDSRYVAVSLETSQQ